MRKLLSVLALGVALSGCSTVTATYDAFTTPIDITKVRQTALTVDLGYQAALDLANVYAAFPQCGVTAQVVCADVTVVGKIVTIDATVKPLVDAMNKTVNTPGVDASIANAVVVAATNGVEALKAAIPAPAAK